MLYIRQEVRIMKLLIVDDEKEVTDSLVTAFKPSDYEITAENDPVQALKRYKKEKFDVVLTDVRMPEMTGIELLKAIREHDPKARVIVVTAYGDLETSIAAINNKAVAFFSKPINFVELVDLLQDLEKEIKQNKKTIKDYERVLKENEKLKGLYNDLLKTIVSVSNISGTKKR